MLSTRFVDTNAWSLAAQQYLKQALEVAIGEPVFLERFAARTIAGWEKTDSAKREVEMRAAFKDRNVEGSITLLRGAAVHGGLPDTKDQFWACGRSWWFRTCGPTEFWVKYGVKLLGPVQQRQVGRIPYLEICNDRPLGSQPSQPFLGSSLTDRVQLREYR